MRSNSKMLKKMNFVTCRARYGIEEMCRDQWNWASKNPYGYESQDSNN